MYIICLGLDLVGQASVNFFVARASATLSAQLFYSDFETKASLNANQLPIKMCGNVHLAQKPLQAKFDLEAALRDRGT
jgi:hypothetical protein